MAEPAPIRPRHRLLHTVVLLLALSGPPAVRAAAGAIPTGLDERVQRLATELRCLVCQNQSIADSQAALAVQLRAEVRAQLARGATDDDVRQFMVQRYGEFVLYRPPLHRTTLVLWSAPALLLLAGGLAAWRHMKTRDQPSAD